MKGQSLIEVVVSLGIITIVVTSVASIVTSSLGNTQFSKDQNTATKYAQEGLEVTRSIRNADYTSFSGVIGTYCLAKGDTNLGSAQGSCAAPNIDNYFIRSIKIEINPGCGNNVSKIISTVTWTNGKCTTGNYCHKSELVSCLSRVNPVKIP